MNKNDMMYFVSGSTVDTDTSIDDVFRVGITSMSNNISTTFMYANISDDEIDEFCKDYGYETVYVIRIPKLYLMPKVKNNNLVQIPLPIWKKDVNRYLLSNELICGAYIKRDNTFVVNPNYKELHNPIGLSFDKKQESIFDEYNINRWQRFYKLRDKLSYDEIIKIDKEYKIWDSATSQYANYFNQKKM